MINKFNRPSGQGPRRVTPQQQLWALTNERQQRILKRVFALFKKQTSEDICYALIMYLRFGHMCQFENTTLQLILRLLIFLMESDKRTIKPLFYMQRS